MEDPYLKKIMTSIILIVLLVLSFFLLKPILLSIVVGVILAFIFYPVYLKINCYIKSPNLSAGLICFLLILVIVLPIWFFTPAIINESIKVFLASQKIDFISFLKSLSPSLFASEEFSAEIGSALSSFVTTSTNSLMNSLSEVILNFPTMFLQSLVVFFTFFYVLRDRNRIFSYMKSLSPFPPAVEKKFFDSSRSIANAVIYGQVVIGVIQGIVLGIGLFIFRVPNPLVLTLLAILAGIFPIIGTAIVWIPVGIYLFLTENTFAFFGVVIFGVISSSIDNFLRPIIVSKRANIDPLLILIGMIGGLFLFGILGFILGPLILAYLVILLELYRNKKIISNILVQESSDECKR